MKTIEKLNQPVLFAALLLLIMSSAASASGHPAAMHRSLSQGGSAKMVPCNHGSKEQTSLSDRNSAIGFGETDPSYAGVLAKPTLRPVRVGFTTGATAGFAEIDPASPADRDGDARYGLPNEWNHAATMDRPRLESTDKTASDMKTQSNCSC